MYIEEEILYNKNESIQVIECLPQMICGDISPSKD